MNFKYLVIEGPIGAGKTTLAKKLATSFQGECILDRPWENPFLRAFYEGKRGAAFKSQLYFLADRAAILKRISRTFPSHDCVISDFLLEKDKLFAYQNLEDDELEVYNKIFNTLADYFVKPDLVIYLKASTETLMERIRQRNHPHEKNISPAYVANLMEAYEHFFFQYRQRTGVPVLVVETSKVNFSTSKADLESFAAFIRQSHVTGLEYYAPSGEKGS
jgi:deoxyadenosine/deoxycytidine kinase